MHACIAIDGTAKKFSQKYSKQSYKNYLRQYWWLIERFIGGGLDLQNTKWNHITLDNGHGKIITDSDLADIIYHIFRCRNAHGEEIPLEYELLPVSDGYSEWIIGLQDQRLHMPERIIWALLAVVVFSKANSDIKTDGEYCLTWGSEQLGIKEFIIKDWWGKEDQVKEFFQPYEQIRVKIAI